MYLADSFWSTGMEADGKGHATFHLLPSYPNPFNARTTIKFSLAEQASIKLEIFDIVGRLVDLLADGEYPAGENCIVWDAKDQASGIYFARLTAGESKSSRKLVLLK